jgi:glycosyltransferase involved in cell wall biosynthesis
MVDYSVGIFATNVNPNMYGSTRNIYYLAKALEEKGCKVTMFCLDTQPNKEIDLNKIYISDKRWSFTRGIPDIIPSSFRVAKKAKEMESEFDIFHSNCCFGFPYAFNRNKPFVVHLRSISLKTLRTSLSANLLKTLHHDTHYQMLIWLIERYTVKNSDLVFCNSKETALNANRVLGVNPSKIKVVHNGVDTEFFLKGEGERIIERYDLQNKKVLLCVTRLDLDKGTGIKRLISTMEIIAKKREDIVLLLVGGGELGNDVRRDIKKTGLSKTVILTGHIHDDHLADFYAAADLFVYPSSPGTTLLEAMAASKPFLLYHNSKDIPSGVPLEKIRDKKIGKIIKDGDVSVFAEEIVNYIDDDKWLLQQGIKGFQYVKEELNWSEIANEVIKYYEEIM